MIQRCNVISVTNLNRHTCKVLLKTPGNISFKSGQYLKVVMNESDKRAFSIASCPDDDYIELHIGGLDKKGFFSDVINRLNTVVLKGGSILIDAPHGHVWYRENGGAPLLLIAGGTGYAYINSIMKNSFLLRNKRDVCLCWGVRNSEDLYYHKQLRALTDRFSTFSYCPVVEYASEHWPGRTGQGGSFISTFVQNLSRTSPVR